MKKMKNNTARRETQDREEPNGNFRMEKKFKLNSRMWRRLDEWEDRTTEITLSKYPRENRLNTYAQQNTHANRVQEGRKSRTERGLTEIIVANYFPQTVISKLSMHKLKHLRS